MPESLHKAAAVRSNSQQTITLPLAHVAATSSQIAVDGDLATTQRLKRQQCGGFHQRGQPEVRPVIGDLLGERDVELVHAGLILVKSPGSCRGLAELHTRTSSVEASAVVGGSGSDRVELVGLDRLVPNRVVQVLAGDQLFEHPQYNRRGVDAEVSAQRCPGVG